MVGGGSMPLSMLFMNRFTGAKIVSIDKSREAVIKAGECINFISQYAPDRYSVDAHSAAIPYNYKSLVA